MSSIYDINLNKFNINKINDYSIIVLIAKRNSGKTFLTKDILYKHRIIPLCVVICPTDQYNDSYKEFIPESFIFDECDTIYINNFLYRQGKMVKKVKKGRHLDPRGVIIMDDCMADTNWIKQKCTKTIFNNGRHFKFMYILTMQDSLGIPNYFRGNIDYVFILREPNVKNRKRLYDHYAGMFPTFKAFNLAMDKCTEDFHCLVIDNLTRSNTITDQVFWYKATKHEDFKFGSKKYWKYHKKRFNPNYNDKELSPILINTNLGRKDIKINKIDLK